MEVLERINLTYFGRCRQLQCLNALIKMVTNTGEEIAT
jgi:hypothetical protein